MPQQQAQPDPLQSYIDKLPIDQSTKADVWDAYHGASRPQDFQNAFDHLNIPQSAKADLWDMRWSKSQTPPSQQGASPVSPAIAATPSRVPPPSNGSTNKTWDQITGTLYPEALAGANRILNQPIGKTLFGIPSLSDAASQTKTGQAPPAQGGTAGSSADAKRIALQTGAGLGDFLQSPAGIASEFLTIATGGAAGPAIAGAFATDSAQRTYEQYQNYQKNPTPENLQNVLVSGAMTATMAAGTKVKEIPNYPGTTLDRSKMSVAPQPIPKGEGTSVVGLVDQPPSTNPSQEISNHTAEIARMQSIENNPRATPEEQNYARLAKQASIEQRDQLARPQSRAESTEPGVLPPRIAPAIAPEPVERGVEGLAPEHQEIVQRIEDSSNAPSAGVPPEEAAHRKMVEDLGGVWHGSDNLGLSHFDVPESIAGRKGMTVDVQTDKLTPDYIKQQFARKVQEFAPKPDVPTADTQTRLDTLQNNSFNKIVDLQNARDAATDDNARAIIDSQIKEELGLTKQIQDIRIQSVGEEGLQSLRDQHAQKAQWYKNRQQGINNLQDMTERNAKTAESISEMRVAHPGGDITNSETGETESVEARRGLGPLAANIADTLSNKAPRYKLSDFQFHKPKAGVDPEEWKTFANNMWSDVQARHSALIRDISILQDTHGDIEGSDIPERLKELDSDARLVGSFDKPLRAQKLAGIRVDVGRRPHLAPPIDAEGNITDPAALWTMDQATWKKISGQKANVAVPEASEVRQFAKNQGLLSELYDKARAHVDQVLNPIKQAAAQAASEVEAPVERNPEAGFAGERAPGTVKIPDSKTLIKRGIAAGIPGTHMITDEKPAGYEGWITSDGKGFIGHGTSHPQTASKILPEFVDATRVTPYTSFYAWLKDGAIRKVSPRAFEVHELDSKTTNIIEMDTIRGGRHGHDLLIDTAGPRGIQTLHIERGWENLADAIKDAKRKQNYVDPTPNEYSLEAGKVPGAINLGAASIGAVGGHIVGGVPGAVGGFMLGYISPELIRTPFVQDAFKSIGPFLSRVGVDAKDWVYGSKRPEAIIPQMRDIIDQQRRDPEGSGVGVLERFAQLPTNARRYLINKFAILDDQRSQNFASALSSMDKRIPSQRPSIDNSPYVSLADAAGKIAGEQSYLMVQFSKVYNSMMKSGLDTHLREYLNLKGYQRTYENLQERVQDGIQQIKAIDQKLADPKLSDKQRVGLEADRASIKTDANSAFKKLKGNEAVPGGIRYTDIPGMFDTLKQTLGPEKYAKIDAAAKDTIFSQHRQALDLAHDSGIVGDELYQKFLARGDEYIYMSRIMSDLADNYARYDKQGKASPMYLNKQNIIRNMEGSERVNQDPLKANMMMDREMISESFRNQTAGEFIKFAENNHDMYGPNDFKKVGPNYKPLKSEAIITHYEDGQPQHYKVSEPIYQALQGASPIDHGVVRKALGSFYNLTRAGATGLNLGFQLMSIPAEIMRTRLLTPQSGLELSGNWMKFGKMWAKNLGATLSKSPEWQEAMRQGYLFSAMQRVINPETKLETASLGVGQKIARLRLVSALDDVLAARSDATKMTGFQMLREQGYSEKAARYNTKRFIGMPDYSQTGVGHPAFQYLSMFFNADLQHVAQSMNALADKPEKLLPYLGAVTAMTLALQQWNYSHKDEDGQPLMRKVPFDERDRNIIILTGGTHQVSSGSYSPDRWLIRKPDIMMWTTNPAENLISKALGHEERSTKSIIADGLKALTPFSHGSISDEHPVRDAARSVAGSVNPLIRLPLEELANKNFGTGSPIVSRDQIDPRYQATANTPSLYTRMGQATGLSPQRLQHVVSGATGSFADTVAQQLDPLLRGNKPAPLSGSPTAKRQTPVIGQALARISGSNIDQEEQTQVTRFYDRAEQFKQVQQTFDYLKKSNPAKAEEFVQQNRKMLALSHAANDAKASLAHLGQLRAEVQSNPQLDNQTRSQQLANIAKARMRYLKAYNSVFDKYAQ